MVSSSSLLEPNHMFSGEKGFEPLTFGFGDHRSTIGTTLLTAPPSGHFRPFRLEAQDIAFSWRRHGFDSRRGYERERFAFYAHKRDICRS